MKRMPYAEMAALANKCGIDLLASKDKNEILEKVKEEIEERFREYDEAIIELASLIAGE